MLVEVQADTDLPSHGSAALWRVTMLSCFARFRALGVAVPFLLSIVSPVLAKSAEEPESFVRRVYARYRNDGPGVLMVRPEGAPFYAARLLDAVAKDSAGGAGSIDWDPLCDGQIYENLRLRSVAITTGDADTVMARVAFLNLGGRHTVVLTLTPTPAGWRIADVVNTREKSIMTLLKDAAGTGSQTPAGR